LADPKIGCGLRLLRTKIQVLLCPPIQGGALADFWRDSPTAGALANFRPVT